jgi:hypothetical protein
MAQWQTVDTVIGYNGFGEIDPYLDWAFPEVAGAANGAMTAGGALSPRRMPVLFRLVDGVTVEQFSTGSFVSGLAVPPGRGLRPAWRRPRA